MSISSVDQDKSDDFFDDEAEQNFIDINMESNVLDSPFNITIFEDIIPDDYEIVLKPKQIQSDIGQLLYNDTNTKTLAKRIKTMYNLFQPQKKIIHVKHLVPLILANTYFYDNSQFQERKKEPEVSEKDSVINESLYLYLKQFAAFNTDKVNDYSQTMNKCYKQHFPLGKSSFIEENIKEQEFVKGDTNAFVWESVSKKLSNVRLIGEVKMKIDAFSWKVYDGDVIDLRGFVNVINDKDEFVTFDFKKYYTNLLNFKEGDKVIIVFNNFNKYNNQVREKAVIVKVEENKILIKVNDGDIIGYNISKYNGFFIYPSDSQDYIFTKADILTKNIIFLLDKGLDPIEEFIKPISISELFFIQKDRLHSLTNLDEVGSNILYPYGLSIEDIPFTLFSYLKETFINSRNLLKKPLKRLSIPDPPRFIVKDNTALLDFRRNVVYDDLHKHEILKFNFLRKQKDFGFAHMLSFLYTLLTRKIESLKRTNFKTLIEKLEGNAINIEKSVKDFRPYEVRKGVISKKYTNLDKLLGDNLKIVYFDQEYDTSLYSLKDTIGRKLDRKQMRNALREEVMRNKSTNIRFEDVEYEIDSIINNKRRVRVGDYAVLNDEFNSSVYVRQLISSSGNEMNEMNEMWIKIAKAPFQICDEEQESTALCIYDSLETLREKVHNLHQVKLYSKIKSQIDLLRNVRNVLRNKDNILHDVEDLMKWFETFLKFSNSRTSSFKDFTYQLEVDYDDIKGDEDIIPIIVDGFGNKQTIELVDDIDLEDENYFEVDNPDREYVNAYDDETDSEIDAAENQLFRKIQKDTVSEILDVVLDFTGINIGEKGKTFVVEYSNLRHKIDTYVDKEMPEYNKIMAAIDLKKPKLSVRNEYARRAMEVVRKNASKVYNSGVILTILASVLLIIFASFPNLILRKINPLCAKFMSYSGYPVEEDSGDRSLVKYFACVLKTLGTPGDMKFDEFSKFSLQEITQKLNNEIDLILKDKQELKMRVDSNKQKLSSKSSPIMTLNENIEGKYTEYFMFKPSLRMRNVNYSKADPFMKLITEMHSKVQNQSMLRYNNLNVPMLLNACCLEMLTTDYNYFTFFDNINIPGSRMKIPRTYSFFLPESLSNNKYDRKEKLITWENKKKLFGDNFRWKATSVMETISSYATLTKDSFLLTSKDSTSEVWWNKLYQQIKAAADTLRQKFPDKNEVNSVINIIMQKEEDSIHDVLNVLFNFIKVQIPLTIHRLKNEYVPKHLDDDKLKQNFFYIQKASGGHAKSLKTEVIDRINKYCKNVQGISFDANTFDTKMSLRNRSIYVYILLTLWGIIGSRDIVAYLVDSLLLRLTSTCNDLGKVADSVEKLREENKAHKIAQYSVDPDVREVQLALRKMGIIRFD